MHKVKSGSTIKERLYFYSVPEPMTGCWLWIGSSHRQGYGNMTINKKKIYAHRASYEAFVGKIPDGLDVMHSCDTPACVNPKHLKPGTHTDNMRDCLKKGRNHTMLKQTHCKRGHEFNEKNTKIQFRKDRDGIMRVCKTCLNAAARKQWGE